MPVLSMQTIICGAARTFGLLQNATPPLPPPRLISRCVACPQQAECQLHLKFDPHLLEVVRFGDLRAITAARVAFEAQVQLSTSVS